MRILITGGGTAGHIHPALAIADEIKKQYPDTEFLFVGAKGRMETEIVPRHGYSIKTVTIQGFSRRKSFAGLSHNVKTVYYALTAGPSCKKILKEFKPDIALGTGGYVCGPILRQAAKQNIPIVLHDSNSFPGVTTKMLAKLAKVVCLPNEEAVPRIPEGANTIVTGNPIRADFYIYEKAQARKELNLDDRPLLLSLGGSLGAARINELMVDVLKESYQTKEIQHLHATGKMEYDEVCEKLNAEHIPLNVDGMDIRPFIEDRPRCMAAADLVVCRCGAMTIGELLASGTPSILIPSPNVAENHQYYNAMTLVNNGAALCIEEKDASSEKLWETITSLIHDPARLEEMGAHAKQSAVTDATKQIVKIIMETLHSK